MKMRAELVVSAPAEDTWVVVGEHFGEIGEWASPITRSAMDGPPGAGRVRTCHVAGFGPVPPGVIRERLLHFDPQARSLSYEAAGRTPGFIRRAVSNWSVQPGPGGGSTVRIGATVTLRRPGPARITTASSPAGTSGTYDSPVPAGSPGVSPFGRHVRRWRAIRRMSQLDLASAAGTTARHISFVETGRSRPGRELILRIGEALRPRPGRTPDRRR